MTDKDYLQLAKALKLLEQEKEGNSRLEQVFLMIKEVLKRN
jgi:hypothetical protein